MVDRLCFYTQETTGIKYPIGDLYGYPDSLIRARTGAAYAYSIQLLPDKYDAVLDIGSGRGHGVKAINDRMSPKTLVSLDKYFPYLQAQRIVFTKDDAQASYHFVNASTSPFQGASFNAVFCMHVIEHLKEPAYLIDEVARILISDGRFIVATPDKRNLVGSSPYDEHVFTTDELASLLERSGFTTEFFYIVPNEAAMRVHERKKWLAKHAPFTGRIRNHVNPDLWDRIVLRSGISPQPLTIQDFTLSQDYHPNAIDIVAVASK